MRGSVSFPAYPLPPPPCPPIPVSRRVCQVLCFTGSLDASHRLARLLGLIPQVRVAEYTSAITPKARARVIERFERGELQARVPAIRISLACGCGVMQRFFFFFFFLDVRFDNQPTCHPAHPSHLNVRFWCVPT